MKNIRATDLKRLNLNTIHNKCDYNLSTKIIIIIVIIYCKYHANDLHSVDREKVKARSIVAGLLCSSHSLRFFFFLFHLKKILHTSI